MPEEPSPAGAYTHGHHESVLRSHRDLTAANSAAYLLPLLRRGATLLDVGCGPGTITADLARMIRPGRVTALEPSEQALEFARAEALRQGQQNIDFAVGDVHQPGFGDDSFDIVHAHQVLQHVPDPVGAIREMVRVCKPGGVVAARDGDYSGFTWFPADPALDSWRELYRRAARANGGEPDAGRMLLAWAHAAGCADVKASSSTWCYADPDARQSWGGMWADRIVASAVADQLVATGAVTRAGLAAIAADWRAWAAHPDGWLSVLHGEILIFA